MDYFCSECNERILPKEYKFSTEKYGKALCRAHQRMLSGDGLSKREGKYKEGMIKGRIAETLIEELFITLGYNVFRYGMENTVPGAMKLLRGIRGDVADNIRKMPDFVVQDKKGNVYFIEVKFSKDEKFSIDNLSKKYPYENCFFIIVSKKHIKCITYPELKNGEVVSPDSKNYLGSRVEFDLDKEVIKDFCTFAVKFFESV